MKVAVKLPGQLDLMLRSIKDDRVKDVNVMLLVEDKKILDAWTAHYHDKITNDEFLWTKILSKMQGNCCLKMLQQLNVLRYYANIINR